MGKNCKLNKTFGKKSLFFNDKNIFSPNSHAKLEWSDIWDFRRLFGCRINGILLFMLNISAGFWYKSVGEQRNCFRPSVDAITAESFCDDTCIWRCYMGWPRQHLHSFLAPTRSVSTNLERAYKFDTNVCNFGISNREGCQFDYIRHSEQEYAKKFESVRPPARP